MSVYMKLLVVISLMLTLSHVVQSDELLDHLMDGDDETLPPLPHVAVTPRVPTVANRPPETSRPTPPTVQHPWTTQPPQPRQPEKITDKQKSEIVNKHNILRASEGASDMEMMTWNESLAAAAELWVTHCMWQRGFPPLPGTTFTEYGQCIYAKNGAKINLVGSIQEWYDQKTNYDYNTMRCAPGKSCRHYTQLVWSTSRQIGCAYRYCDKLTKSDFRNAEYLACNYVPAGNFEGLKPFKKGPQCSQCVGGAAWCKGKLCNSQCSKAGKGCVCMAICHNCATLNRTTCRCSCDKGWTGPDCSVRCEDRNNSCNNIRWHPYLCTHREYGLVIKSLCPVMCKLCKPDPNATAGKCPPVYAAQAARVAKLVQANSTGTGFHHQQQRTTVTLFSYVILSLTITCTLSDSV